VRNHPRLDRSRIRFRPIAERANKVSARHDLVDPDSPPRPGVLEQHGDRLRETAERIRQARDRDAPVILSFGAHTIKNGLGPVLVRLMEEGFVSHLATNGAGIIHDWELTFLGETSEDVRANLADGSFGNWEETGRFVNLALLVGAYQGLGYGESVGAFVADDGFDVPSRDELRDALRNGHAEGSEDRAAAASMLLKALHGGLIAPGPLRVVHPWKRIGVQAAARRLDIPYTGHPMFGHDIIYTHPLNSGAAIGLCAERDFLCFAGAVAALPGGVYLSIGSAVMSPMVFEKSLSMARNVGLPVGERLSDFAIQVVDLMPSGWDWVTQGEPPPDHPDYYLRFMKSFGRAGARDLSYLQMDNRDYLLGLYQVLRPTPTSRAFPRHRSSSAPGHGE
jgi:hypothetical protein